MKTRLQPVAALTLCGLVLPVFVSLCVAAPSTPLKKKAPAADVVPPVKPFTQTSLVGEYRIALREGLDPNTKEEVFSSKLLLRKDGSLKRIDKHEERAPSDGLKWNVPYEISGSYVMKGGFVVLTFKYPTPTFGAKPQSVKGRTQWVLPPVSFLPVRWGERLYLVQRENAIRFCNAVNLGDEPVLPPSHHFGVFYLRTRDEAKPAPGLPQMPAPWSAYLLSSPVRGKVVRIANGKTAIINVGNGEGIRKGMAFARTRIREPYSYEVVDVTKHEATLRGESTDIPNLSIGDELSTRRTLKPPLTQPRVTSIASS